MRDNAREFLNWMAGIGCAILIGVTFYFLLHDFRSNIDQIGDRHAAYVEHARKAGIIAKQHGIPATANPYIRDTSAGPAWLEGYMQEQDKK